MKKMKSESTELLTVESLYLNNLTIKELESLLPCYRPDIEKIIKERITDLRNLMDAEC